MSLNEQQKAFLTKHLKVAFPDDATADDVTSAQSGTPKLLDIWRTAKERTDTGIAGLQTALKRFQSPVLDRIAEAGLNGISEGNSVGMMRAIMNYDAASPDTKANLMKQIDAYRAFLQGSTLVTLAESNPFGITVDIKAPLETALNDIAAAVAQRGT
ncbi:MAG: hypothetical protein AAF214_11745 [Pseudomonadota bacterium]